MCEKLFCLLKRALNTIPLSVKWRNELRIIGETYYVKSYFKYITFSFKIGCSLIN